jgi:HEPN domain-containing protein
MRLPDAPILDKVKQWVLHADEDLQVARHGFLIPETPPCRTIAFHAQQCAEKYLKAYLVYHTIDFPFTHDIAQLLEMCAELASWTGQLTDAEELSVYAVTARYPGEDLTVSEPEARRAVETAERVRQVIRSALKEEGFEADSKKPPS